MATKKERAHQIRIASLPGENTAERVGALLEDMVAHQDSVDTAIETFTDDFSALEAKVDRNKDEAAGRLTYIASTRELSLQNDKGAHLSSATMPEATLFSAGMMSAADKNKLIGIPNAIRDLGTFTSAPAAESAAAWADIVTDKKIAFVLYVVNKNGQYYSGIIQNQYAPTRNMQYLLYDGARYSRYIDKDASGNVTAVQSWQRDGVRNIDYNANNRTLSLKDMFGSVIGSTATLPEASTSHAGMMSAADKAAVNNIENIETNVGTLQTEIGKVKADVETLGGKFLAINYGGTFDVGTTIPVAEFLSKSYARNSILIPTMYIFYGHNSGNRENAQMIWRQYDDNSGSVTFSFAYFDGAAVVKKVLTLNEAEDTWTVTE